MFLEKLFGLGYSLYENLKTALVITVLAVLYGFFPFGLDSNSEIVFFYRIIVALGMLIFLLIPAGKFAVKRENDNSIEDIEEDKKDQKTVSEDGLSLLSEFESKLFDQSKIEDDGNFKRYIKNLIDVIKNTFAANSVLLFTRDMANECLEVKYYSASELTLPEDLRLQIDWDAIKTSGNRNSFFSTDNEEISKLFEYEANKKPEAIITSVLGVGESNTGLLYIDSFEKNAYSENDLSLIETYAGIISDTLTNYNNLIDFENSAKLYSFFYEITKGLNTNLKFEEIFDLLFNTLKQVYYYDRLTVSIYEPDMKTGKIYRLDGQVDGFPEGTEYNLNDGLNGWILKTGKSMRLDNLEEGEYFRPRYSSYEKSNHDLKSFLAVPIIHDKKCFGAVCIESKKQASYKEKHEQILKTLTRNFAAVIDRGDSLKKLEKLALTDGLTRLNNYRAFAQRIKEEQNRAERYQKFFTLLFCDIDDFKHVNDKYGHLGGNEVLLNVAQSIESSVRNVDLVFRYGGEEFAVILVETPIESSFATAERIRKNIEDLSTDFKAQSIKVTMSIGVVELPEPGKTIDEIVDQADKALYRAKEEGKNKIVAYTEKENI